MVISVGYGIEDFSKRVKGRVVDARPSTSCRRDGNSTNGPGQSDVWTVVWENQRGELEEYFVVKETCEVVGVRSLCPDSASRSHISGTKDLDPWRDLRPDWAAYLRSQASSGQRGQKTLGLMNHLGWTNGEDYEHGISRLWLKTMRSKMQEVASDRSTGPKTHEAELKIRLAQRYILACVVGNRCVVFPFLIYHLRVNVGDVDYSVSGEWMSTVEMSSMFDGHGSGVSVLHRKKAGNEKLSLFLPAYVVPFLCLD